MPDTYQYTQLSDADRHAVINARIRDLETQHLQLAVRINAPGIGEVISDADKANLTTLESSLAELKAEEANLTPSPGSKA